MKAYAIASAYEITLEDLRAAEASGRNMVAEMQARLNAAMERDRAGRRSRSGVSLGLDGLLAPAKPRGEA